MENFKISLVLTSLVASNREALTNLQRLNNAANGKMYNYQFPSMEGKKWVVWFYADMSEYVPVTEDMLEGDE